VATCGDLTLQLIDDGHVGTDEQTGDTVNVRVEPDEVDELCWAE